MTLFRTIEKLSDLQSIALNFSGSSVPRSSDSLTITDRSLCALIYRLEKLASLQSISLRFSWRPELTGTGIRNLGEDLQSLTSLKSINLDFDYCEKITNKDLMDLRSTLERYFESVKIHSINKWF